jgi:hypothetical protein
MGVDDSLLVDKNHTQIVYSTLTNEEDYYF